MSFEHNKTHIVHNEWKKLTSPLLIPSYFCWLYLLLTISIYSYTHAHLFDICCACSMLNSDFCLFSFSLSCHIPFLWYVYLFVWISLTPSCGNNGENHIVQIHKNTFIENSELLRNGILQSRYWESCLPALSAVCTLHLAIVRYSLFVDIFLSFSTDHFCTSFPSILLWRLDLFFSFHFQSLFYELSVLCVWFFFSIFYMDFIFVSHVFSMDQERAKSK